MRYFIFLYIVIVLPILGYGQELDNTIRETVISNPPPSPKKATNNIELQVVATKSPKKISDIPADVMVFSKDDLKNTGTSSIVDVLRNNGIAAFDTTSTGKGAALYIRGLDISYLLLIIDGQRVKDANLALKRISANSIERIEIVKGPSSYLWGSDAMAGVIYIQTKKGSKKKGMHGSVGVKYGNSFENLNTDQVVPHLDLSYSTGTKSFYAGGSFDYGHRWSSPFSLANNIPVPNERRDHGDFNVYGGTDLEFNEKHALRLDVNYYQNQSPLTDPKISYNGFTEIDNPGKILNTTIGYHAYPSDKLDVRLTSGVSYEAMDRIFSTNAGDFDKERFIANNTELLTIYSINDSFTLKSGYSLDFYRRSQVEDIASNNLHYNAVNNALFFGGEYQYKGKVDLSITLGARYQYNYRDSTLGTGIGDLVYKAKDAHSFSPEFGLVLKPVTNLALKAHVGHSFKSPDLESTFRKDRATRNGYAVGGNPNLTHEQAWGYSGTIEYTPVQQLFMSIGIHRMDIFDLIQSRETGEMFTNNNTILPIRRPFNLGRAYTWGISTTLASSVEIPRFGELHMGFNLDYTVAREKRTSGTAQYQDENGNNIVNPFLADRPPLSLSGSIGWTIPKILTTITFSGYYFHSTYTYQLVNDVYRVRRSENQVTFDLRLSQPFTIHKASETKGLLFFEAKNLLNATYDKDFDGDTDQQERSFIIGLNIDF
ncbi:MAG: TonB-dependent receptor plug domain-containing protein [Brevinema sp.]